MLGTVGVPGHAQPNQVDPNLAKNLFFPLMESQIWPKNRFSVTKATLQPPMSIRSFVRLSVTKTPKQLKINQFSTQNHTHTTSHTHKTSQHSPASSEQQPTTQPTLQPPYYHQLLILRLLSFSACYFYHLPYTILTTILTPILTKILTILQPPSSILTTILNQHPNYHHHHLTKTHC